jgi:hypothetical protein
MSAFASRSQSFENEVSSFLDISDQKRRFKSRAARALLFNNSFMLVFLYLSFFTDFAPLRLKSHLMGIPARSCQERNFILDKSDPKSKIWLRPCRIVLRLFLPPTIIPPSQNP